MAEDHFKGQSSKRRPQLCNVYPFIPVGRKQGSSSTYRPSSYIPQFAGTTFYCMVGTTGHVRV